MKKILFISLLVVTVFLVGSSGVASASCTNYQDYSCPGNAWEFGMDNGSRSNCVEFCYDDGFSVGVYNIPVFFNGTLYPATSNEHLLGTFYDYDWMAWGGLSVDRKGRSIIVKLTEIEDGDGWVDIYNCTPCNNCCRP